MSNIKTRVVQILGSVMGLSIVVSLVVVSYFVGFAQGANLTVDSLQTELEKLLGERSSTASISKGQIPTPIPVPSVQKVVPKAPSWGGPELWDAVNKKRVTYGVNPLKERDELCTIASIRLNQLLELGKLDAHVGFSNLPTDRPDLKWIFDKYTISEFLVSGATSADNAVALWDNTLGHKKLLSGGEYSYGCIYAQNGFGVAIAAY